MISEARWDQNLKEMVERRVVKYKDMPESQLVRLGQWAKNGIDKCNGKIMEATLVKWMIIFEMVTAYFDISSLIRPPRVQDWFELHHCNVSPDIQMLVYETQIFWSKVITRFMEKREQDRAPVRVPHPCQTMHNFLGT